MTPPNVGTITCNGQVVLPGVVSGCASHHGHYAGKHAVAEALSFGWADTMAAGAVETYDEWSHREDWAHADHWNDMVTDAEDWLNEHTEGGVWWWSDGDFRVDATEECPHCGDTRWSDPNWDDFECDEHMPMN